MEIEKYQQHTKSIGLTVSERISELYPTKKDLAKELNLVGIFGDSVYKFIQSICEGELYGSHMASSREGEKGRRNLYRLSQILQKLRFNEEDQIISLIKEIDQDFTYPPIEGERKGIEEELESGKLRSQITRKIQSFTPHQLTEVSGLVDRLYKE